MRKPFSKKNKHKNMQKKENIRKKRMFVEEGLMKTKEDNNEKKLEREEKT